jgi:hypothetical protein
LHERWWSADRSDIASLDHAGGAGGSAYSEGGALYALGLIHANHGQDVQAYLLEALRDTSHEVVQHGACLGLGLASLGTGERCYSCWGAAQGCC